MKSGLVFVLGSCLFYGCASHPASVEVAQPSRLADSGKWNREFHGAAEAFTWHRPSIVVALPKEIAQAKLTPVTIETVTKAEVDSQKTYGSHWVPVSAMYRAGDTVWQWTGYQGRVGFLIKSGDEIKAWRFVHYGPF